MDLHDPPRKPPKESVVPMINVVFLLLIFFLMTATIAPPEPFEVELPQSVADAPSEVNQALYVAASGEMTWGDHKGEAIYAALARNGMAELDAPPLVIRADRNVSGAEIARLLKRLATLGITQSQLVAETRS